MIELFLLLFVLHGDTPEEWLQSCDDQFDPHSDYVSSDTFVDPNDQEYKDWLFCRFTTTLDLDEYDLEKLGRDFDWLNYTNQTAHEFVKNWGFYQKRGIEDTLKITPTVSGLESLPPPMLVQIEFDYFEDDSILQFNKKFHVNPSCDPPIFDPPCIKEHASDNSQISTIYSKNGTNLRVLKLNQEVDIIFDFDFDDNNKFDGYVYYNIREPTEWVTQLQNFTSSDIPKTFKFSYVPNDVGNFSYTYGIASDTGTFYNELTSTISVIDHYSKAMMPSDGNCNASFPEFVLVIKPDFSTGACVKMHTSEILKERGWN